ncbi:MAG: RHS repeat-associated core domain-containing protein [Acidobacteriota bacterium]
MTSQTATKGATSLMNMTYNYQALAGQMGAGSTAGNADQLMSITGTINSTTESAAYTYDLLGRLATSNQTSNGSSAQRLFEYDRWGNRTAVYDGLPGGKTPPTQIQSITYPSTFQQGGSAPTNRIGSVTNNGSPVNFTYDAAGNVTNDGLHTYGYDAENRVVSVDSGATAQYRYDHQNRRVTKIVGSSWTHYVWQGSQVVSEHDATTPYSTNPTYQAKSARVDYIYSGARRIQSRQRTSSTGPWTSRYFLSDRLSTRITLDTSGNVVGRQAHLPFGEDFGESGTQEKHHLTGYERDSESGTDYAVNRQYAQTIGRFNRTDPFDASSRISNPQSLNRYSYTGNNPVNRTDRLGLDFEDDFNDEGLYDHMVCVTDEEGHVECEIVEGRHRTGDERAGVPPPGRANPSNPRQTPLARCRKLLKDLQEANQEALDGFTQILNKAKKANEGETNSIKNDFDQLIIQFHQAVLSDGDLATFPGRFQELGRRLRAVFPSSKLKEIAKTAGKASEAATKANGLAQTLEDADCLEVLKGTESTAAQKARDQALDQYIGHNQFLQPLL